MARMDERVLSTRDLNRALLARQLLLERSGFSITRALERVGGLQTQYAPSGYVALWSRLRGFRRAALTRGLERRQVVQGTLMRVTIHMVSARDFPLFSVAIAEDRREWWLRVAGKQIEGLDLARAADLLRRHLSNGPLRLTELQGLLKAEGYPSITWSGARLWLDLVRVPPSGTWDRPRADLYGLAEDWIGPSSATRSAGFELVVRRYLGAFGPASVPDMASWAGLPVSTLRSAVERLKLRRFRDEDGNQLLDVPRAPLPEAATPAPVRFLPPWEALLLVHARRTQVLPEEHRPSVFNTRTPHSVSTFLVDGAVAGMWRHERGRIHLEPFEPIPHRARRELEDEAKSLAAFYAD